MKSEGVCMAVLGSKGAGAAKLSCGSDAGADCVVVDDFRPVSVSQLFFC